MSEVGLSRMSDFEDRLRKSGYQQLEPFFLLREGIIHDERNGKTIRLDRSRLESIARIQNQRVETTGDATPIIIGHTKKNKKEAEQPALTGWATRFDVAPFMNTGRYGLRAVPWSRPENLENFEKFPRRSAELWTDPDLIDPISLLGPNTPRLDLGVHRLQRNEEDFVIPDHFVVRTPLCLEMDNMPDDQPNDRPTPAPSSTDRDSGTPKNDSTAAVFNSPEWKQMQQTVAEMAEIVAVIKPLIQGEMGGGEPSGAPPGGGAPPMGAPPGGAPPGGAPMGPPPGPPGAPPTQMSQGFSGSPAGGTNSMMPTHMQRDPNGYDPRDAEIQQLRQQMAAMQLSMIESTVNTVLDDLEGKIVVDRPRDFAKLVRLSKAEMDSEVQFMIQTRRPIDPPAPPEGVPLHLQAGGNSAAARQAMGPVQLTMEQAKEMYGVGADPALANIADPNGPQSTYDFLMDVVRNRGRQGTVEAYEKARQTIMGTNGSAPSVRR